MGPITKIQNKIRNIPDYIKKGRLFFALRLYLRKYFVFPVIIRTIRGSRIFLGFDSIDDVILKHLNVNYADIYFPTEIDLHQAGSVLDVGAHHGIFALEFSHVFPQAHLYSFEPDPASFRYLKANLLLNRGVKITPINAALSDTTGISYIVRSDEGSWGNYVTAESESRSEAIRTLSIEDFIARFGVSRIDFIKLNAEGAEFIILPGLFARNVFPKAILLFGHPEKGNLPELLEHIKRNSYVIKKCRYDKSRPWFIFVLFVGSET